VIVKDRPGVKIVNIPIEICRFFNSGEGQTLLVKGLPGTGKTTLAFEILKTICQENNGMYISTRVDPVRLYATFPWIRDVIPSNNVINATQAKLLKGLTDLRPGGTATYGSVLDFFRVFFDESEDMDNPMIVIDSWDAVMNYTAQIVGSSRQSFEQNICEFARDLGIHLIFVSETADLMPLDYIVDGVVSMEQFKLIGGPVYANGRGSGMRARYAREIRLEKLRGVEIGQRSFTVTLHGGRFSYFEPYQETMDANLGGDAPRIPDPGEARISTGIQQLDTIVDGLRTAPATSWR